MLHWPFLAAYHPSQRDLALQVVLGIAVTVIFQGNFEKEGYRLGRLAAGLYRMPPSFGQARPEGGSRAEFPQVIRPPLYNRAGGESGFVWVRSFQEGRPRLTFRVILSFFCVQYFT